MPVWKRLMQVLLIAVAIAHGALSVQAVETLRVVIESTRRLVVKGVSLGNQKGSDPQLVRVYVEGSSTAILGSCESSGDDLVFVPRYPLRAGVDYRVEVNWPPAGDSPLEKVVSLSRALGGTPTSVAAIYPSGSELPENLLKFYIQFSAPMNRGGSYRHVVLLDQSGKQVKAPFLEIGEELWDQQQLRLTLLLDPGRIKRGLKPHEEVGLPLTNGNNYTLLVDSDWRDAHGRALSHSVRKEFRIGPADYVQPNANRWRLHPPQVETLQPLRIEFDEPLDRAMLEHCLQIFDGSEHRVSGTVSVPAGETAWRFRPESTWQAGTYTLSVDARLEDMAGNSLGRLFEEQQGRHVQTQKLPDFITIRFQVAED